MRFSVPILWIGLLISGATLAQSPGYLYIESEPSRPFYLRTADSLYSSSAGNYLILAPLRNMVGEVIVGFPGTSAAFSFSLKDTSVEQGLILRDLKEEGWRLYDFRKNELVNVRRLGRQANELNGMTRRTDAFAVRLSQVVNDSIILYYKPAAAELVKGNSQLKAVVRDSVPPAPLESAKSLPAATLPAKPLPGIRRLSKMDLGNRWLLQFESREGAQIDTIQVEIDKPVRKKKSGKLAARHISESSVGALFSHHEQVLYRSHLPWNKLRWLPKAGECAYGAG